MSRSNRTGPSAAHPVAAGRAQQSSQHAKCRVRNIMVAAGDGFESSAREVGGAEGGAGADMALSMPSRRSVAHRPRRLVGCNN